MDSSGFTLVEVLLASAVFVVVFMMLATLFGQATVSFAGTRLLTATQLARSAMERALASGTPISGLTTVRSNRVAWEIEQSVETASEEILEVRIVVKRVSDGKVYASLWTQIYKPNQP